MSTLKGHFNILCNKIGTMHEALLLYTKCNGYLEEKRLRHYLSCELN